jgi:hypothetical protein
MSDEPEQPETTEPAPAEPASEVKPPPETKRAEQNKEWLDTDLDFTNFINATRDDEKEPPLDE